MIPDKSLDRHRRERGRSCRYKVPPVTRTPRPDARDVLAGERFLLALLDLRLSQQRWSRSGSFAAWRIEPCWQTLARAESSGSPPFHFVPDQPHRLTTNNFQSPYSYHASGLLQIAVSALLRTSRIGARDVLAAEHCRYGTRDLARRAAGEAPRRWSGGIWPLGPRLEVRRSLHGGDCVYRQMSVCACRFPDHAFPPLKRQWIHTRRPRGSVRHR